MARQRKAGETLEELEENGARRLPKKKRMALPHVVEEFLSLALLRPDDYHKMPEYKQREIDRETLGFYKAQEKLREFIALAGTDAIADLADVRDDRQAWPLMIGNLQMWRVE